MYTMRLLSLALCLAVAACSDDDNKNDDNQNQGDSDTTDTDTPTDEDDPTQPLTVAEICELYAVGVDNFFDTDACGLTQNAPQAGIQAIYCGANGEGTKWATRLLESATANRISIDWAKARQCNTQSRALRLANTPIELARNSAWQALRTGDCATFYTPLVDTNGSCTYVWDCKNPSDFCSTDAPYATESFTCKPRLGAGADCDQAFHPCNPGLICSPMNGKCMADVLPCASNQDCVSGSCLSGACVARGSVDIGGACQNADDCKEPCAVCNQHGSEAARTCKALGTANTACEIFSDCADGLGCSDGICKTLPAGTDCDHANDLCERGTQCLNPTNCPPLGQPDCTSAAPYCAWNGANCVFADGRCTAAPSSGPCLPTYSGQRCLYPAECLSGDETCRAPAAVNEPCEDIPVNAPRCGNDLQCVGGVCVAECSSNSPCAAGQYCDNTTDPSTCAAIVTDVCTQEDACGSGKYCPQVIDVCTLYTDSTTCTANVDCSWNGADCVEGVSPQRHCVDLRAAGEEAYGPCTTVPTSGAFGQNFSCQSHYCMNRTDAPPVCVVTPRGCLNSYGDTTYDGTFIAIPFIFGLVRWNRRRKR